MTDNSLSGNIPSELGLTTSLSEWDMWYVGVVIAASTHLSCISIVYFVGAENLYLENNTLTDRIPSQLGLLGNLSMCSDMAVITVSVLI